MDKTLLESHQCSPTDSQTNDLYKSVLYNISLYFRSKSAFNVVFLFVHNALETSLTVSQLYNDERYRFCQKYLIKIIESVFDMSRRFGGRCLLKHYYCQIKLDLLIK